MSAFQQPGAAPPEPNNLSRSWIMACYEMDVQQLSSLLTLNPTLINSRAPDGGTALHIACRNGDIDMVNFLVKNGADIDATSMNDQTALDIAAETGNAEVTEALRKAKYSAGAGIRSVVGALKRQRKALITSMKTVPRAGGALTSSFEPGATSKPPLTHAATRSYSTTDPITSTSRSHSPSPPHASSSPPSPNEKSSSSRSSANGLMPSAEGSSGSSTHLSVSNTSNTLPRMRQRSSSANSPTQPQDRHAAVSNSSPPQTSKFGGVGGGREIPCIQCSEREELVGESRKAIEMLNDRVRRLKTNIMDLQDQVKTRDDQVASQQDALQDMVDSLRERHNTVESYRAEVHKRGHEIEQLNKQLEDKDKSLTEVEKMLTQTTSDLATAQKDLEKARSESRAAEARMKEVLSQERLSHREDAQRLTREVESARTSGGDKLNAVIAERNRLKKKNESLTRDLNAMLKLVKKYEKRKPMQPSATPRSASVDLPEMRATSYLDNHRTNHARAPKPRRARGFSVDSDSAEETSSGERSANNSYCDLSVNDDAMSTTSATSESDPSAFPRHQRRYTFESRMYPPSPANSQLSAATEDPPDYTKAQAFQRLTSELSESILEKEQVIESLRKMNTFLGKRVLELEKQVGSSS